MSDGDRLTRPLTEPARKGGDETGPSRPDVRKPEGGNELLKRMKRVDPDQAKRYRQRSGQ
ncbi:MAG: ubiquitin-like protein UBact [Fimbriimonas ginsengisoli]|uniref:Prokaryotic ubiquitin-like protein UBact n=1 Tax=Fimbriimonas ginsengisoli TaxID=1005039 RepID=A0A931LQM8_FIMGI|nr:ubiquitin-like protein UBact [Fimbriimonas ginsengisoli]MBI3721666.1 ubiquitin-like protein UBact [Fimbriimonas ginsengisoli]